MNSYSLTWRQQFFVLSPYVLSWVKPIFKRHISTLLQLQICRSPTLTAEEHWGLVLSLADLYSKPFIVQLQSQGEADSCFDSCSPTALHPLIHAIAQWPWINVLQARFSAHPLEDGVLECTLLISIMGTLLISIVVLAMCCKHWEDNASPKSTKNSRPLTSLWPSDLFPQTCSDLFY